MPVLPGVSTAVRDSVPLTFEATIGTPRTRVGFSYDSGEKKLSLTWSEKDAVGVYIKTVEGSILRAGSIYNAEHTRTNNDKTCIFSGRVLQKFDGEKYLYMHPDLGNKTALNFEDQFGHLDNTDHLSDNLPIVWNGSKTGVYKGYVVRLIMTFTQDPGSIRKVSLLTRRRGTVSDRIFPRNYSVNDIDKPQAFIVTDGTEGTEGTLYSGYTDAISLNVTGSGTPRQTGLSEWTAEAYLACATVQNLNVFSSKVYIEVINHDGRAYTSEDVSFKGQTGATAQRKLYAHVVFPDESLRKMAGVMSSGGISPTIINHQYNIASILGMWDKYGRPYDPNGLIFYKDGTHGPNSDMPKVLIDHGNAIHDRYRLTNSPTGTPTFTWQLYNAHTDTKQDNTTVNNIDITAPTEVFISFLSEYAWNQNLLGYYHYPTNSVPGDPLAVMKNIVFPNISKPGHEPFNTSGKPQNNIGRDEDAPLREYETVKLIYTDPTTGASSTTFPEGTTIGFWGMIDVKANGFQQGTYSLLNWNQWRFFSNSAWNSTNSNWSGAAYNRCNFFASGDVCNTTGNTASEANNTIIRGIAIYGFKDNVTNEQNTAYSTCIFLVSTSVPEAMTTHNAACFNIGCTTSPYPSSNIVIKKE